MRRAVLLLLALGALAAGSARADDARLVQLTGPGEIQGILREDVDGDGVLDLLAVEGRTVWIWSGRKGALPAAAARRVDLPDDASFVDATGTNALVVLGRRGLRRMDLGAGGSGTATVDLAVPDLRAPTWRDGERAVFADLVRPGRLLLAPVEDGWHLVPLDGNGPAVRMPVEPTRFVVAAGQFLEDPCSVTEAWPEVFLARATGSGPPVLWSYSGDRLVAQAGPRRVSYDLSALPPGGERRLADLDADGVPDVVRGEGTNSEIRVGFFHVSPPPPGDEPTAEGASLRRPLASLRLTGFPVEPQTVDLDGDGRPDFLVTTIEIDQKNVLRAVASGKVTARTRAFLNRRAKPTDRLFTDEPDATIWSDVSLRIRFGYAGSFDVRRSFTMVVDGDYDGDRRKDLVIRIGPDELQLRPGAAAGVWDPEGRMVRIPPMETNPDVDAWAADVTGDGRDELVLRYRKAPGGKDRIYVVRP